jgi:hypothetical protein
MATSAFNNLLADSTGITSTNNTFLDGNNLDVSLPSLADSFHSEDEREREGRDRDLGIGGSRNGGASTRAGSRNSGRKSDVGGSTSSRRRDDDTPRTARKVRAGRGGESCRSYSSSPQVGEKKDPARRDCPFP